VTEPPTPEASYPAAETASRPSARVDRLALMMAGQEGGK